MASPANNADIGIVTVNEKGRMYRKRRRTMPTPTPLLMIRSIRRRIRLIRRTKVKTPSPTAKEATISLRRYRSIRQKGRRRLVDAAIRTGGVIGCPDMDMVFVRGD